MTAPSPSPARANDAARALDPLRTSRVALLTTYRRDGRGVDTPVGIQVGRDQAFFTTRAKTWKVRRLARSPRVRVAPCTRRGRVTGSWVECTAHRLDGGEARSFEARFWVLVYRVIYRDTPVRYELRPVVAADPGPAEVPAGPPPVG
ncbi:PPOX class F420-dependent oxidoreductase [Actinopolymorpha pittospori]